MFALLLILLVGTLAWLWWHRRTTSLSRDCRWRQDRGAGLWRCVTCGGEARSDRAPVVCARRQEDRPD